jgi:hypothetical protein
MMYLVKGEFMEENIAGKPQEEALSWIEKVVHPSLEALDKAMQEKKITGGTIAGERIGVMIVEAPSNEEVGRFLRSLPFWGALRWTIVPLQSFKSTLEQDKTAFRQARAMAK